MVRFKPVVFFAVLFVFMAATAYGGSIEDALKNNMTTPQIAAPQPKRRTKPTGIKDVNIVPGEGSSYGYEEEGAFYDMELGYSFSSRDYEKLGPVAIKVVNYRTCVLFSHKEDGLAKLLLRARSQYPETDALMNVYFSKEHTFGCLSIFKDEVITTITATAVKMRDK